MRKCEDVKLARISGYMYLRPFNTVFSMEELLNGAFVDKCNPTLNFEIEYETVKGKENEDVEDGGKEYYITGDNERIYAEYDINLDNLWMNHPIFLNCSEEQVTGEIYVLEDEIQKGYHILITAFKNLLKLHMNKLELLYKAIEEGEHSLTPY